MFKISGTGQQFIIVEGLLALEPEFRKLADISVFIDASTHDRVMRKVIRNKLEYRRTEISWTVRNYLGTEEPSYRIYTPHYRAGADIVIKNKTMPIVYSNRYSSIEVMDLPGETYCLIPKELSGELNEGEQITLHRNQEGANILRYEVSGNLLFQTELDEMALKALSCYYSAYKLED